MRSATLAKALAAGFFSAVMVSGAARAEIIECTVIDSVPTTITAQGVYCLKGNLGTNITAGDAIEIATNNVTIDFNGYKLGGLAAGPETEANGIHAENRKNITIRNGTLRGFGHGIDLGGTDGAGHVVEDLTIDFSRNIGIRVQGNGHSIVGNTIVENGDGAQERATAIDAQSADNLSISGNKIVGTDDIPGSRGIYVWGSDNVALMSNVILSSRSTGLAFKLNATNSGCQSNVIGGTLDYGATTCTMATPDHLGF